MISRQAVVLAVLLAALSAPATAQLPARAQSFDHDPTWPGHNNRARPTQLQKVHQDFGYDAKRRQIGGEFLQTLRPAWDATPTAVRSLDHTLSASGTLYVPDATSGTGWQNSSNLFIGWFDADERAIIWRPRDFIGFRLQSSHDPAGAVVEISYGASKWQADGAFVNKGGGGQQKNVRELTDADLLNIAPDGKPHRWSFRYHPAGAGGEIVFTFDGAESRMRVGQSARAIGPKFNHFGIFTPRIPGRRMIVDFEDISIDGKEDDFSIDPKWEGVGNRAQFENAELYAYNNFGYSATSFAGGTRGELGGRFISCDPPDDQFKAWHGDDVGWLSLRDHLIAPGKFMVREFSIDSTFALGWFNSEAQGWPIKNFVGVYFDSLSSVGRIAQPLYGTSGGNDRRDGGYVACEPAANGVRSSWMP